MTVSSVCKALTAWVQRCLQLRDAYIFSEISTLRHRVAIGNARMHCPTQCKSHRNEELLADKPVLRVTERS
jgi:hypothetical protein